jgi:pimeloyl-ACP methyl ester carboxylesterase
LAEPAEVTSYAPTRPRRIVAVAHGYPWPDYSRTDAELLEYTHWLCGLWRAFADEHDALVVLPPLGSRRFADYRTLPLGDSARAAPDAFLDRLVDQARQRLAAPDRPGFALVGHSAGAQFAARYLVLHAHQLDAAVISAPSTYPFPGAGAPWPYGTAGAPVNADWLAAASTAAYVCVGSDDRERQPPGEHQPGLTRLARAVAWTEAMRDIDANAGRVARVSLTIAPGIDHDEERMTGWVQQLLDQHWRAR